MLAGWNCCMASARRAVAALERIMIDERLLQRLQRSIRREAFDRRDRGTIGHDRKREAGIDAPPIHQDCARAALPVIAALLCASQVEMVPQHVEQGRPGRDPQLSRRAVNRYRDRDSARRRNG